MSRFSFVLIFVLLFHYTVYGACSIIPESLERADVALENGEIDSLCYWQFRSLILQPVNPLREGWGELELLGYERDGRAFPSVNELLVVQKDGGKEKLYVQYPWLKQYDPLFTLESREMPLPVTGMISTDMTGGYFSGETVTRLKAALKSTVSGSGGELQLRAVDKTVRPVFRRAVLNSGRSGITIQFGNFSYEKRDLLWGNFSHVSDSDEIDQWLYGTKKTWNGGAFSLVKKKFTLKTMGHVREKEHLVHLGATVPIGRFKFGIDGLYENQNDVRSEVISFSVEDSFNNHIELSAEPGGGFGIIAVGKRNGEMSHGEAEVWFISEHYSPIMSSKVNYLKDIYGREKGTAVGIRSNSRLKLQRNWSVLNRFDGEVLDGSGRVEFTITVQKRNVLPLSLKTRLRQISAKQDSDQQWEQYLRVAPQIQGGNVSFPLSGSNLLENGKWDRSSVSGGVTFKPGKNLYSVSIWQRWYELRNNNGIKGGISQNIGTMGRGSLAMTIPFSTADNMEMHGKVEFFF